MEKVKRRRNALLKGENTHAVSRPERYRARIKKDQEKKKRRPSMEVKKQTTAAGGKNEGGKIRLLTHLRKLTRKSKPSEGGDGGSKENIGRSQLWEEIQPEIIQHIGQNQEGVCTNLLIQEYKNTPCFGMGEKLWGGGGGGWGINFRVALLFPGLSV